MLVSDVRHASSVGEEVAAPNSQKARKRHRMRHTKSRHGCLTCKSRRVKCDEARPVCGACSSRGEPCSFPDKTGIPCKPNSPSRMREAGPRARSGGVPHDLQPYLEPLEADTAGTPQSVNEDLLEMGNLLMMQFYHLHTAKKMSADQKRARVWQRVIPHLAGRNRYLMHLLLALGGIHMITERLRHRTAEESDLSETVDLRAVMRHHQKGLEDFREDMAQISNSNAEAVYAGSLLLAGFIFASLQVPELNPNVTTANSVSVPHAKLAASDPRGLERDPGSMVNLEG
ncbi:Zn(II)2Cys6 transcription factor [Aspergillus chevalieri]|uniref:Zn(2)-C6 fungal-type domain-containing protein n=1 Tax=Aspergillus chevalieri TaxID=182096 RepID=A0A7R7VJN4_ASPCH|nr:uncharacterized protein ACHE_21332S [Aspergillus chevalieri]BCR85874.1 hypothetical protein ACHE_21332S [Aspergillus chevalieri]